MTIDCGNRRFFDVMPDKQDVEILSLNNGILCCDVLTLGAILRALYVKDSSDRPVDVVLGCDRAADYLGCPDYIGAIVGRYANRIAGGSFTLNGKAYQLSRNSGANHIHGGFVGFSHKVWTVKALTQTQAVLRLESEDGEEGYPGKMWAEVTYTLEGSCLCIRFEAESDRDTLCNLTSHSYFNLSGHDSGCAMQQEVAVFADYYTPTFADGVPDGRVEPVDGTPMDLREPVRLSDRVDAQFSPLVQSRGFDHNYVLSGQTGSLHPAACAASNETGIRMRIDTTLPGVQLYTANFLDEGRAGKGGAVYGPRHAFCLETEFFPDSPNHPEFPDTALKKGERYTHETRLTFDITDTPR